MEKTRVIKAVLGTRKYEIMMNGSRHLTTRSGRHQRRIPWPEIQQKEDDEEDDKEEEEEE